MLIIHFAPFRSGADSSAQLRVDFWWFLPLPL
jgi:hypothetical protein